MRTKIVLISIIIIATFLRFYNLSSNPPAINWDEASLGYNAWTLLNYGTDEYGNVLPFSIRSFNDYKPPLYSYLTTLPVAIFGLNEFSTRFISALLGTLTTIVVYFLTNEFLSRNNQITNHKSQKNSFNPTLIIDNWSLFGYWGLEPGYLISLLAALLFAISPWSLQFSRGAFEGNIAVFFTSTGMLCLLKWLNMSPIKQKTIRAIFYACCAMFSVAAALYSYHAARLVIPLLLLTVLIRYYKFLIRNWMITLSLSVCGFLLIFPLLVITFRGSTGARAEAVSIFNPKYTSSLIAEREQTEKNSGHVLNGLLYDTRVQYLGLILKGYLDHYNVSDMFIKGDVVDRHHAPNMGLLYLVELPFIIIGLYTLAIQKFKGKFIFWSWWLLAPLPAALASGTPHAIRSILWLPLPQIAAAVGIMVVFTTLQSNIKNQNAHQISRIVMQVFIPLIFLINFSYYLVQYHVNQPIENATNWQYGYKQLINYLSPIYPNFDQVIMTTSYDQPYIFFLFYEQYKLEHGVNPGDFNHFFKNITFEAIDIFKLREQYKEHPEKSLLIIGAADEVPKGEPIEMNEIKFPDGKVAFRIVKFVEGK